MEQSRFHRELHSAIGHLQAAQQGQMDAEAAADVAQDCLSNATRKPAPANSAYAVLIDRAFANLEDVKANPSKRIEDAIADIKQVLGDLHNTEPDSEDDR